ncbi:T9SS type A sorting domain-containing protein [candidate division KSB1 bacterium]|nr:T9SS type A sorting domain-containing protein [candidate division KSB1 bacterium]
MSQPSYLPRLPFVNYRSLAKLQKRELKRMRIFSSIVILQILLISAFTNLAFTQSKGGQWQFENNGNDTAEWDTTDNSGVLESGAFYVNSNPSQEGSYYLNLNNSYSHLKINDSDDIDFKNENIGISLWINTKEAGGSNYFILNKGIDAGGQKTSNYALRIGKSKNLELLIRDSNNKAQTAVSSFIIEKNVWTFIAVYYDYDLKKVYFWNQPTQNPVDTLDYDPDFSDNADPLTIGGRYTSDPSAPVSYHFKGYIDDVRISGRVEDILSPATHVALQKDYINPPMSIKMGIYPNPSSISENNGNVSCAIELNNINNPSISIFNVLGQRVMKRTLSGFDKHQIVQWNRKDSQGNILPTGTYFVRINNAGQKLTKRLMIIQ